MKGLPWESVRSPFHEWYYKKLVSLKLCRRTSLVHEPCSAALKNGKVVLIEASEDENNHLFISLSYDRCWIQQECCVLLH